MKQKYLIPIIYIILILLVVVGCGDDTEVNNYQLTIRKEGQGQIGVDPVKSAYPAGEEVTVASVPAPGWQFDYWGGAVSGQSSSQTVVLESNKKIIGYFSKTIDTNLNLNASSLTACLTGSISDSRGSIAEVKIDWGDNRGTIVDSGFNSLDKEHTYQQAGTYDLEVIVDYKSRRSYYKEFSLEVADGVDPPQMEITSNKDGLSARITGSVSDADGISRVEIDWGDGSSSTVDSGFAGLEASHQYEQGGEYKLRVEAIDQAGDSNYQQFSLAVNQPPTLSLASSSSGLAATITGSISDSYGVVSEVKVDWGDSSSETINDNFSDLNLTHEYSTVGDYTITVTATDNQGATRSQELGITTNHLPTLSLNSETSRLTATITGSVSDKNNSLSEVVIDWGEGSTEWISSGFASLNQTHQYSSGGEYTVTVTAKDETGDSSRRQLKVEVVDPILELVDVDAGVTPFDNGSLSLDYSLEVAKYEVTQAEFIRFLNNAGVSSDGSYRGQELIDMEASGSAISYDGSFQFTGDNYFGGSSYVDSKQAPVLYVSWYGAVAYCNWLSKQEGLSPAYNLETWSLTSSDLSTLSGYRLPTESEWEYVARGGDQGEGTTYAGSNSIEAVAWYWDNSGNQVHPVGEKEANELGIYDLSGNVWEWTNTVSGSSRIGCGGSWHNSISDCRVDVGYSSLPSNTNNILGFRPVRTKQ